MSTETYKGSCWFRQPLDLAQYPADTSGQKQMPKEQEWGYMKLFQNVTILSSGIFFLSIFLIKQPWMNLSFKFFCHKLLWQRAAQVHLLLFGLKLAPISSIWWPLHSSIRRNPRANPFQLLPFNIEKRICRILYSSYIFNRVPCSYTTSISIYIMHDTFIYIHSICIVYIHYTYSYYVNIYCIWVPNVFYIPRGIPYSHTSWRWSMHFASLINSNIWLTFLLYMA